LDRTTDHKGNVKDIEGAELACISNTDSDTSYRLFRKDGRTWVRVWVHFRARIEGLKQASNYEIHQNQFDDVVVSHGKTLKSIVDAKLLEIDSN
jgi:hypothetical protein